jgi:hypothetical protein
MAGLIVARKGASIESELRRARWHDLEGEALFDRPKPPPGLKLGDLLRIAPGLMLAAWSDLDDLNAGDTLTEAVWQKIVDNFAVLKTHTHDGTTGGGATLSGAVMAVLDSIPTATSNDASWVTLLSYSIPQNTFYSGSKNHQYELYAWVKCINNTGSARTWHARIVLGATTIAQTAVTNGASSSATARYVLVRGLCRSNDSHDVQVGNLEIRIPNGVMGSAITNFDQAYQDDGTGAELNSSGALTLSLDFSNQLAHANLSHQVHVAYIQESEGD